MIRQISNTTIVNNVVKSVMAQIISLSTSFIINLVVPKFIDQYEYAYWQIFLLYEGYVGILHLGILDGIILKFSKYEYENLDKNSMNYHFSIMLFCLSIFSVIVMAIGLSKDNPVSIIQWMLVGISIITKNIFTYASYSFQITNRIKEYAITIIRQRIIYAIFVVLLLLLGFDKFYYFCIVSIGADLLAFLCSIKFNKHIFKPSLFNINQAVLDVKDSICCGFSLMIANFSSGFIVGSVKLTIQNCWATLIFGQVSFAFSMTNFFLTFINAISIVLFPALKRMNSENMSSVYMSIRTILSPMLLIIMLGYFPGCIILNLWLPNYSDSLYYLGILMPLIIYSTKVSLLTNNYLKFYRKEKEMMLINFSCILIEIVGLYIIGVLFRMLNGVLIWTVFISMLRFVVSENLVLKIIKLDHKKNNLIESVVTVLFIYSVTKLEFWVGFIMFGICVCVYCVMYQKSVVTTIKLLVKSYEFNRR